MSKLKVKPAFLVLILALFSVSFSFFLLKKENTWPNAISRWSYTVTMLPHGKRPSSGESGDGTYYFIFDEEIIAIRDNHLYVNYADFGTISTGSTVLIDYGVVSVDGKEREGSRLSHQDALALAKRKKSKSYVGGRKVEFVPAPNSVSITTHAFSDKETLSSGNLSISVDGNNYTINNAETGVLHSNQSFRVYFGKVSITNDNSREQVENIVLEETVYDKKRDDLPIKKNLFEPVVRAFRENVD